MNNDLAQIQFSTRLRAGDGIRVGLQNLFNDNSDKAKLLAFQLELLKNHLGERFQISIAL